MGHKNARGPFKVIALAERHPPWKQAVLRKLHPCAKYLGQCRFLSVLESLELWERIQCGLPQAVLLLWQTELPTERHCLALKKADPPPDQTRPYSGRTLIRSFCKTLPEVTWGPDQGHKNEDISLFPTVTFPLSAPLPSLPPHAAVSLQRELKKEGQHKGFKQQSCQWVA